MDGRIGALHVRYRTPRGSTTAVSITPALDRAIASGLGETIGDRLSHVLGPDPSVIVIRDLTARLAMGPSDWSLDSRAVERIGRASCAAVLDILHTDPAPDQMMRFDDEPAFIGSFIVDLLNGTAWDRWYYGAFQQYRTADPKAVLLAVLAANASHAARVFAWLSRRGSLNEVLLLLGSAEARRLLTGHGDQWLGTQDASDIAPLVDAALALLEALGWPIGSANTRLGFVARHFAATHAPPWWSDRRSLSAWVLACVRDLASALATEGVLSARADPAVARALLSGRLDWLDTEWLGEQLPLIHEMVAAHGRVALVAPRVLSVRHEQLLERLARLVRERRVRFDRGSESHAVVVRLIAALAEETGSAEPVDRALTFAVERIAEAWDAIRTSPLDDLGIAKALEPARAHPPDRADSHLAGRLESVHAIAPAAITLLREVVKATAQREADAGETTPHGGLFLLTRGLLDVRLHALAREAGVPFHALLAALAEHWVGAVPPYDGPTGLWLGVGGADLQVLVDIDAQLMDLRRALMQTLIDQRCVDAPRDEFPQPALPGIAWLVMRAWSRWLPGLATASIPFLLQQCLAREARVMGSDTTIDVQLAPAPLDVVLEMAGYLKPVESVPWLNGRTITFVVRRVS